jgi:hypothetical protein
MPGWSHGDVSSADDSTVHVTLGHGWATQYANYLAAVGLSAPTLKARVEAADAPLFISALLNEFQPLQELADDGIPRHPLRGLDLTEPGFPRSVAGGWSLTYFSDIELDSQLELRLAVIGRRRRIGQSGEMVLVDVLVEVISEGDVAISGVQTRILR